MERKVIGKLDKSVSGIELKIIVRGNKKHVATCWLRWLFLPLI
jgi:hypothetical protein